MKDARGRSPTLPSPTLFPGALLPKVTRSISPVNPSSGVDVFTQIWNAFPKGVASFHPGPEHKKDILTSGIGNLESESLRFGGGIAARIAKVSSWKYRGCRP